MAPLTRPMWFKGIVSEDTPPFKEGEMAYGKLHTEAKKTNNILCKWIPHIITDSYRNEIIENPLTVPVRSETLSEWTGLEDADGTSIYENDIITDGRSMFKVEYRKGAFRVVPLTAPISEKFAIEHPRGIEAEDQYFLLSEQLKNHDTYVLTSVFSPGWLLRVVRNLVKDDDFPEELMEDGIETEEDKVPVLQRLVEAENGEFVGPFKDLDELMRSLNS